MNTVHFPNGACYQGGIKDNQCHGIGTMIFPDGAKYEGEWENDLPNGEGSITHSDGTQYTGKWVNGQKHGQKQCGGIGMILTPGHAATVLMFNDCKTITIFDPMSSGTDGVKPIEITIYSDKKNNKLENNKLENEKKNNYDFYVILPDRQEIISITYENIAITLYHQDKYDEALENINKSIEILPYNPSSWLNKGMILIKMNLDDDAIRCFEKLISLHPSSKKEWYFLGKLYEKRGKLEEALKALKMSQSISSVNSAEFLKDEEFIKYGLSYWMINKKS